VTGLFAACARGVEGVLARELTDLGMREVRPGRGGVTFAGDLGDCMRANLWLRTASHVLWSVARFPARSPEELYAGARVVSWDEVLTPAMTFAVHGTRGPGAAIANAAYAALKVKDAIADALRDRHGARPSVDPADPDLRVRVHLERGTCALYLDASGEGLHRRGYRPSGPEAPLKETLAAAILLLAGWDGTTPLCDPLCGSGTLVVEGALLARRMAPGLRRRFAFERWRGFDPAAWTRLRAEAAAGARPAPAPLVGGDRDPAAVALARRSAQAAGVGADVAIDVRDLRDAAPPAPPPGLVAANPPYGERLGDRRALGPLYAELGTVMKRRFAGYRAAIFTASAELARAVGLRPTSSYKLYNGPIECRVNLYEMYEGTRASGGPR
jgi:putative N6-adenine-specific DNA methylase